MADKTEIKTYALGIGTWECYDAIVNKKRGDALKALCNVQGFLGVHPTDRVQVLLYLTPAARRKAYQLAQRMGFRSAMIIKNTAYVPDPEVDDGEND